MNGAPMSGAINPTLGNVTIAGPDGNPLINPATGRPYVVDLTAFNTPPKTLPTDAGAVGIRSRAGTESYIVPTQDAAASLVATDGG